MPLQAKLSSVADTGLDFGCGHGPASSRHAPQADGFSNVSLYDPFFFPDTEALTRTYDFITCTETAEHFPSTLIKEFNTIDNLLDARRLAWES